MKMRPINSAGPRTATTIALLAGLFLYPLSGFPQSPAAAVTIPEAMRPNMNIATKPIAFTHELPVTEGIVHVAASASGQRTVAATAMVSAPIGGQVVGTLPQLGESVQAGQSLVTLISPQLAEDRARWSMARAKSEVAKQSLGRDEALYKNGLIPKKRLDATRAAAETAMAELAAAKARLRLAGVRDFGQNNGGDDARIAISAPVSGVVTQRTVIPGTRVTTGQSLLEITAANQQWWLLPIPPGQVPNPGVSAQLRVVGCPDPAPVRLVDLTVDPRSQLVTLRAQPKVACQSLRPGQIGMASLWVRVDQPVAAVPITALIQLDDRAHVFVERQGHYFPIPVALKGEGAGKAYVDGSLRKTDRVVVHGMSRLKALMQGMGAQ